MSTKNGTNNPGTIHIMRIDQTTITEETSCHSATTIAQTTMTTTDSKTEIQEGTSLPHKIMTESSITLDHNTKDGTLNREALIVHPTPHLCETEHSLLHETRHQTHTINTTTQLISRRTKHHLAV